MSTRSDVACALEVVFVAILAAAMLFAASGCKPPPVELDAAEIAFGLIEAQHNFGIGDVPPELWAESQALIKAYRASTDQAERARITWRLLAIKAEVCPMRNGSTERGTVPRNLANWVISQDRALFFSTPQARAQHAHATL